MLNIENRVCTIAGTIDKVITEGSSWEVALFTKHLNLPVENGLKTKEIDVRLNLDHIYTGLEN